MFSNSTQKKFWTFSSEEELTKFRYNANKKYTSSSKIKVSKENFLSPEEELVVVKHHEKSLISFFHQFRPRNESLPKNVKGTSIHFYKRFYLVSSVMDYHPKDIMLTCVFLSCKICEYNVPIDLFVKHIEGNPTQLKNIIIDQEMQLLYRLNFTLNIFLPYQAVEGLMIDLKTRSNLRQPERLNEHISRFLYNMWWTDICLLYPPSQIALAAVMHAVSRCRENIDDFVMHTLLNNPRPSVLQGIIATVRKIRSTVVNYKDPQTKDQISRLENRLALCRNPFNDPSSQIFKRRMMECALETYVQQDL